VENQRLVLLTGATGYVGGRLLNKLELLGVPTRCLARRPENLRDKVGSGVEVVAGDVMDVHSLAAAFAGVHTAFYLIHSMGSGGAFEDQDRLGAQNFAKAAATAGVQRIVYLGGLGDEEESLSPHLRSRHEVGDILRASGVPVIEFRASIILGSGSLSFELIRSLVERLPVMIMPRWVRVPAQPIAINDVLSYLIAALDLPLPGSRTFEIGGADQMTYADLMREYARQRGLTRWLIPVPVLTPYLSSLWLGLVTPVFARIGRKLIESIRHPTIVRDPAALAEFPIHPIGVQQAIADALRNEDQELAQTRWSDAMSSSGAEKSWFGVQFGPRLVDSRTLTVEASAAEAFAPIRRIGGKTGWYCADWLWRLRGVLDLLVGGVGLRRGRRDAELLCVGDTVDCWRVEGLEPNRLLRLSAEMKLPGRAWLEFEVTESEGRSTIRQTAIFDPVGLLGRAYWYLIYPLHQYVFAGMLRGIAEETRAPNMSASQPTRAGAWGQAVALAIFLVICLGTAGLGAAVTNLSVGEWYASLAKPSWNPPNWVFGPIWTALYVGMALAAWLVWRRRRFADVSLPLILFGVQLFLNAAWSALFFGMRNPGIAFADIVLLWLAIVATIVTFGRVSALAATLLVPYLAWVSFATALNWSIWRLNS
jgi:uncharacterized protein YbjT (DUF2867 family)/tryptophan-rich sensory protein